MFARCGGIAPADAERVIPSVEGLPALAFWVSVARELCEETGVLVAQDDSGHPIDARDDPARERIEGVRRALVSVQEPFHALLARERWFLDLSSFRYLSHFIQ